MLAYIQIYDAFRSISMTLNLANGDVIVTLLPVNTRWPWITPALFRPELVPEELMAQGLTVILHLSNTQISWRKCNFNSSFQSIIRLADRRGLCARHGDVSQRFSIHFVQRLLQTCLVDLGNIRILCANGSAILGPQRNRTIQPGRCVAVFECGRHIHVYVD